VDNNGGSARGGVDGGGDTRRGMKNDPNNIVHWILVSKRDNVIQRSELLILMLY
jgi:hypothetical protein